MSRNRPVRDQAVCARWCFLRSLMGQPAPRRSQANRQMGAVVCYRCGQQGHLARGCAQPRQATPQGTTKTNYPVEQNAPPTFSINNVSSYLLSCRIYDSPVSFLIDTGAGVSLLSKLAWDKIKPTEEGLNPIVTHRLVGVDGVPIKVDGTVSVPITIGKVTLQHDFIVAEQITAEAILGLDFLEANKCILDLASGKMQIIDQTVSLISQPSIKKVQCAQVTVTENLTIPPRSEMEIMARIHSKEEARGCWRYTIQGTTNLCSDGPKEAECSNPNSQRRPLASHNTQKHQNCHC